MLSRLQENGEDGEDMIFASELVVVDKQNKCQLLDGSYELSLQDVQPQEHKQIPKCIVGNHCRWQGWYPLHKGDSKNCQPGNTWF